MFFYDHLVFIPAIAWCTAVGIKGIYGWRRKSFSWGQMLGSGGMPSVHSALVTSLTTAVGIKYGIFHDIFLICLVFATIIIYDAINVRFEAGLHAKALNVLLEEEQGLNESIGHRPEEALAGSVVGIIVAIVMMNI